VHVATIVRRHKGKQYITFLLRRSYRDGKKGHPIIVYGVLTDAEGRPVAVEVYPGNTGDPTTVPDHGA